MKIDLHVHTKKMPNKDVTNRNIKSFSDFCDQMEESNVGIVAITNHNHFDFDQYTKIIEEINNRNQILLVIPGIEIDIIVDGKRKQVNVLFSPNDISEGFSNFYNFFKDKFEEINSSCDTKGIEFTDFKNYFLTKNSSNSKVILYLDNKQISENNNSKNSTSFTNKEISLHFNELKEKNNICIVRDVNKELDFNYFMYWNENSLIGSDNLNWDDYIQNSSKLLEYNTIIDNFDDLFLVFKKNSTYDVFKKFNLLKIINDLKIKDKNKEYTLNNIKIIEGATNIIFGTKATGKTSLLKAIYERIESTSKCMYESEDKLSCIDDYKNINSNFFDSERKYFNEQFEELTSSVNSENEVKPSDFYNSFISKGKNKLFPFIQNYVEEDISIYEQLSNSIKNNINKLCEYIDGVNNIKKLIFESNLDIKNISLSYFEKEIENIIDNNINAWLKIKTKISIHKTNKDVAEKFKKILEIYKKTIIKPNHIGLVKLFEYRKKIKRILNNLQGELNRNDLFYEVETFCIPNDNGLEKIINLKYKLTFLYNEKPNSEYSKTLKWLFKKYNSNNFVDPTEKIEQLKNLKKDNFVEGNEENKNFIFFCGDQQIRISKGERYFLNLSHFLNKNKDYYFLDEPETSLNNVFISKVVQQMLIDINRKKKTIVMTTHNNILGINSGAMNFIFRDNKKNNNDDLFDTLIGNIQEVYLYNTVDNSKTDINIRKKLFDIFEGDEPKYKYRRKVYEL